MQHNKQIMLVCLTLVNTSSYQDPCHWQGAWPECI